MTKLKLYEEMKPFIEFVYFEGDVKYRDESKRLVDLMEKLEEGEEAEKSKAGSTPLPS